MPVNWGQALQTAQGVNRGIVPVTGIPSLDATPAVIDDPYDFRREAPGNTYDLTFLNAANLLPDSAPTRAAKRIGDFNLGVLGKVAYYADRPYTGVMSFLDAATAGRGLGEAAGEAWKGFTGHREAGFVNLLENAGFNPADNATQWLGVGLDVVVGSLLDPVNWLTLGTSKGIRGIKAGTEILDVTNPASRFAQMFPSTWRKLNDAGITHVPGRLEAARAGLWGLNVRLPYLGKESYRVTPIGVNALAAKGLDSLGNALEPVGDFVHKFWGGTRYWAEKSGLGDLMDWFNEQTALRLRETVNQRESVINALEEVPVEERRLLTHVRENPELVNVEGDVRMVGATRLTPEGIAARNKEMLDLREADAKVVEEFNRAVKVEIAGLENGISSWEESAKRHRIIRLDALEDYMFNTSDPMYHPGDALEEIIRELNVDPRRVESAISQLLSDHYGLPQGTQVTFKAVVGEKTYARIAGKEVMEAGSRAPQVLHSSLHDAWRKGAMTIDELVEAHKRAAFPDYVNKKALGRSTLYEDKGGEIVRQALEEAGTPKPGGAMRPRTPQEIAQAMRREMGEFVPEMASDLDETGVARILVEVPAFSTLSEEFRNLGGPAGLASMTLRKDRVQRVLDALKVNAERGGNNLAIVENYGKMIDEGLSKTEREAARKAYLAEVNRMKKRANLNIDPNSPTFTQIVESIHARRISNEFVPGYYTRNARRLSDELLAGELFGDDPAARYFATQEAGRAALDEVNQKIRRLDEGHLPAASEVPPEIMDSEDLRRMAESDINLREALVQRRGQLEDELFDLNRNEKLDAVEDIDYDPSDYEGARRELLAELEQVNNQIGGHSYDPMRELQTRLKQPLIEERDELIKQLKNPDPFERAAGLKEILRKKLDYPGKHKGYVETVTEVKGGGLDVRHWTPEMYEKQRQTEEMWAEIADMYESRYRKYDPNYSMPIKNYVSHFVAGGESAWDKVKKSKAARAYRKTRTLELQTQNPGMRKGQIDRILEQEMMDRFGIRETRLSKLEREAGISSTLPRKYSKVEDRMEKMTILAMKRSKLPINWEEDMMKGLNYSYSEANKFAMGFDAIEELIRRNLAIQVVPGQDLNAVRKMLKSDNIVRLDADAFGKVLGTDNPFANLYVDRITKQMFDRYLTGQVQAVVSNEAIQKFLDVVNAIRKAGSAWTLLPFPSYHFRNLAGDTLRATHEGLNINLADPAVRRRYWVAWKMAAPMDGTELAHGLPPPMRLQAQDHQLSEILDELRQKYPNHADQLTPEKFQDFLQAHVTETNYRDLDNIVKRAAKTDAGYPWRKGLNWLNLNPQNNPFLQWAGRNVGNRVQNQTRVWLFLDRLEHFANSGLMDLPDAMKQSAALVRKSLFDYTDLLPIEQHVWKNINWFYTYMSRSVPYHIEKMITEPGTFSKYYRAYNGAWNFYEDEFRPDDTREFLSETMGIPVKDVLDEESGERKWLMWSPEGWIGAADVNEAAEWLRSAFTLDREGMLKALSMNTNPIAKASLEQLFAVDTFTGQKLDPGDYSDVFGFPTPYPVNRLLRNIRLVNEVDKLNPGGLWTIIARDVFHSVEDIRAHRNEAAGAARWMQFATGMRLFDAKPSRDVRRNLYDALAKLRESQQNARSALRQGNTLEFNKNREKAIELVPQIQEISDRLAYWNAVIAKEKKTEAIARANE